MTKPLIVMLPPAVIVVPEVSIEDVEAEFTDPTADMFSDPQQMPALISMSCADCRNSVEPAPEFQVMWELMTMSPLPALVLPGPLVEPSALVCSQTLVPLPSMLPIVVAAALSIVRSVGSTSQVPAAPLAADALTTMSLKSTLLPEVSTRPPLPPLRPPLALNLPCAVVWPPDQITT